MTYTAEKPKLTPSSDELRARIPGWGADLDPAVRPSVPRLQFDPNLSGARWELPEQQPEKWPRERSIEHARLTPVFGTSCPPKGVSGAMRKFSYRRFSEGRAAHWLLLLAADRVQATGAHVGALLKMRPDPIASGLRGELKGSGISSRFGKHRTDLKHQWLDPLIIAGPWLLAGGAGYKAFVRARRRA
jgi:hypothetical protein